jgi:hypothetical protein
VPFGTALCPRPGPLIDAPQAKELEGKAKGAYEEVKGEVKSAYK